MNSILKYFLLSMLVVSSAFFINVSSPFNLIETAEAKMCPPGEYPNSGSDGLGTPSCQSTGGSDQAIGTTSSSFFIDIYNTVAAVLLAGSILSLIYAAYLYITSSGDVNKLGTAKGFVIGSLIGIIIILSGFSIMSMVSSLVR